MVYPDSNRFVVNKVVKEVIEGSYNCFQLIYFEFIIIQGSCYDHNEIENIWKVLPEKNEFSAVILCYRVRLVG